MHGEALMMMGTTGSRSHSFAAEYRTLLRLYRRAMGAVNGPVAAFLPSQAKSLQVNDDSVWPATLVFPSVIGGAE